MTDDNIIKNKELNKKLRERLMELSYSKKKK